MSELYSRISGWKSCYWLAVPLLAIAAYGSVLTVGFLSDDFVLLYQARTGVDLSVVVPAPHFYLYRPAGVVLVWQVGWQLWGFNPLPYHIQGLLLHAGVSLLLGLWLSIATGRQALGWLAGVLFAVYPLNLEAVAWVAAQWDSLAVFFGLFSICLFTLWLRGDSGLPNVAYAGAVLFYGLAVFTKESMLTFLPMFALSAWLVSPEGTRARVRRLAIALVPFLLLLVLNIGIRLFFWGTIGGYASTPLNFGSAMSDALTGLGQYAQMLLAPLNRTLFGEPVAVALCVIVGLLIALGLLQNWRADGRILAVAASWIMLALMPVVVLPASTSDLQNDRYLYLAACGYCVMLAVLISGSVLRPGGYRWLARASITLLIVSCAAICWVQLSPWWIASRQVAAIECNVANLVPAEFGQARPQWFVENLPDNYKGAYLLRLGMGTTRYFTTGDRLPTIQPVADISSSMLTSNGGDAFALRFALGQPDGRYPAILGGGGVSIASELRSGFDGRSSYRDFGTCEPGWDQGLSSVNAVITCTPGEGIGLSPTSDSPQLVLADMHLPAGSFVSGELRLQAQMRYVGRPNTRPLHAQWFFQPKRGSSVSGPLLPVRMDGGWYAYWRFIPYEDGEPNVANLRFEPVNGPEPVVIRRVQVDLVVDVP